MLTVPTYVSVSFALSEIKYGSQIYIVSSVPEYVLTYKVRLLSTKKQFKTTLFLGALLPLIPLSITS